jgi:hypothetical protein
LENFCLSFIIFEKIATKLQLFLDICKKYANFVAYFVKIVLFCKKSVQYIPQNAKQQL